MKLIDTHCHIHFPDYASDIDAVFSRMREKEIGGIVIGTTLGTSRSAVEFATSHEDVWATVGFHPEHFTSSFVYEGEEDKHDYSIEGLEKIARSSKKVVAIGEIGLDFYRIDEGLDRDAAQKKQEESFREQLRLAKKLDLPIVIHCREALARLAEILREEQGMGNRVGAVVHCFTGTWEEAKPLLDLGCYLSFSGVITFPAKKTQDPETHVHRVIERMPLDRLLVETDAPFLTPVPHRGERNEPAYVEFVAQKVAELREISTEDVCRTVVENAKKVFRFR